MYCSSCGSKLPDDSRFCSSCGAQFPIHARGSFPSSFSAQVRYPSAPVSPAPHKKSKKSLNLLLLLPIVLVLAIGITALVLFFHVGFGKNGQTVYMLTKKSEHLADGVAWRWTDYVYDESAQLLEAQSWQLQPQLEYDPVYNVNIYVYNDSCEAKCIDIETFTYNSYGHATSWKRQSTSDKYEYTYSYNEHGQVLSYTVTSGDLEYTYHLEYDDTGSLVAVFMVHDKSEVHFLRYEYDEDGRLVQEAYCSLFAHQIDYIYQSDKLIQTTHSYFQTLPGREYERELPYEEIASERYVYNGDHLTERSIFDSNGQRQQTFTYEYEGKKLSKMVRTAYLADGSEVESEIYLFDSHGNVTEVICSDGSRTTYEYEAISVTEAEALRYENRFSMWDILSNFDYRFESTDTSSDKSIEIYTSYWLIPSPIGCAEPISYSNDQSTPSHETQQDTSSGSTAQDKNASYYGKWEVTGLKQLTNDSSNATLNITKSGITISTPGGESIGPLEYTESYDSHYTYLEINDDAMPFVLVVINKDMIGMFWSTDEVGKGKYTANSPWGTEFNAEAEITSIFMRQGAGTTELPNYLDLNKVLGSNSHDNNIEYLYYPNACILQVYTTKQTHTNFYECYYAHAGGGVNFIESIALSYLDSSIYDSQDISTDSNFTISDNK